MKKKYYLFEMDMLWLQIISTVLLIFMFFLTLHVYPNFNILDNDFAIAFIFMIPYMILHELLHSMAYVANGAKFKNITYGVHLDKGILCCLCKQNITKKNILISLLTPFIIMGVLTYIIGILINSQVLVILSIFISYSPKISLYSNCTTNSLKTLDFLFVLRLLFIVIY